MECKFASIKIQIKPKFADDQKTVKECMFVCKWGGEITHAGLAQTRQYVPVFWDEILRPVAPRPPPFVDDPDVDAGQQDLPSECPIAMPQPVVDHPPHWEVSQCRHTRTRLLCPYVRLPLVAAVGEEYRVVDNCG